MTAGGLEKKFDISGYLKRIEHLRKGIDEGHGLRAMMLMTLVRRSGVRDPPRSGRPIHALVRAMSIMLCCRSSFVWLLSLPSSPRAKLHPASSPGGAESSPARSKRTSSEVEEGQRNEGAKRKVNKEASKIPRPPSQLSISDMFRKKT
eukprot:741327-Hanusia_phi.AAC.6